MGHFQRQLDRRQCRGLILESLGLQDTVATEYVLSTQFPERPSTSSSLSPFDYGERIPVLLTALKYGNPTAEDTFQAEVCLAWLHWTINEPTLALSRLPPDVAHAQDRLMQTEKTLSGWTHVCIVKGGYLRGKTLHKISSPIDLNLFPCRNLSRKHGGFVWRSCDV